MGLSKSLLSTRAPIRLVVHAAPLPEKKGTEARSAAGRWAERLAVRFLSAGAVDEAASTRMTEVRVKVRPLSPRL
jgi:hypothetical protein